MDLDICRSALDSEVPDTDRKVSTGRLLTVEENMPFSYIGASNIADTCWEGVNR